MRLAEEAEALIAGLNREMDQEGDPARVRYMTSGPSWSEDDDGWRILVFWELPEPEGTVWPSEELRWYRRRVQALFEGEDITVESYFRTREELETGEYHTGWPIRELA